MKTVCVVGLGYVGLPTALVGAQHGFDVIGFDIDAQKVKKINSGIVELTELGINERLRAALESKRFYATTELPTADCFIIAVPTPLSKQCGADLSYVFAAVDTVIKKLSPGNVIIIESTIPVGTTDLVARMIEQKTGLKVGNEIFVAHCPERVWPSRVFEELINNERIIGGVTPTCSEMAAAFYSKFVKGTMHLKSATFAELLKLTENSSIDVAVALAHQVAVLAEELGFDPYEVISIANRHPRVKILTPTCGVGGHCVAIDPWFLINTFSHKTKLFQAARLTNDERPQQVIEMVLKKIATWRVQHDQEQCRVQLLGLTYKPNVDDLRESPALEIAHKLFERQDIELFITEPNISSQITTKMFGNVVSLEKGIEQADVIVALVAHDQFKTIDLRSDKEWLDFAGLGWQQKIKKSEVVVIRKTEKEINL